LDLRGGREVKCAFFQGGSQDFQRLNVEVKKSFNDCLPCLTPVAKIG
jgi:hypothetical protein